MSQITSLISKCSVAIAAGDSVVLILPSLTGCGKAVFTFICAGMLKSTMIPLLTPGAVIGHRYESCDACYGIIVSVMVVQVQTLF